MKTLIVVILLSISSACYAAEKSYILPEVVRDAIIKYLIKQPYEEVASGIEALMTLKEVPEPEEKKPSLDSNNEQRKP